MAQYHRKMIVNADHLHSESGPPWTVLWNTKAHADGEWNTARVQGEGGALERAAHFLKLGFFVHAIKDSAGIVVMDAEAVATRFAVKSYE